MIREKIFKTKWDRFRNIKCFERGLRKTQANTLAHVKWKRNLTMKHQRQKQLAQTKRGEFIYRLQQNTTACVVFECYENLKLLSAVMYFSEFEKSGHCIAALYYEKYTLMYTSSYI